jgi:hypothetical protein
MPNAMRADERKLAIPIAYPGESISLDVALGGLVQLLEVREEVQLLEAYAQRCLVVLALGTCAHPFTG